MTTFQQYASYYDLLYGDKDYDGEAAFVADIINSQIPDAKSILDLGCGTGLHALGFARRGYSVVGIDLSHDMISHARRRLSITTLPTGILVSFDQGDIRTTRLMETFDVVISLFHVMSYQTTEDDLITSMTTAAEHLKPGGIFIFDYWYGPSVLKDPPTVQVKCMEDEAIRVTRVAEPSMHPNKNLIDVHYEMTIEDRTTGKIERVCEDHTMRYFSGREISRSLKMVGLEPIKSGECPISQPAGRSNWSGYVVAARVPGASHLVCDGA